MSYIRNYLYELITGVKKHAVLSEESLLQKKFVGLNQFNLKCKSCWLCFTQNRSFFLKFDEVNTLIEKIS